MMKSMDVPRANGTEINEPPKQRLTRIEAYQIEKRSESPDVEAALLNYFRSSPESRAEIMQNPFNPRAQARIPAALEYESWWAVLRAAAIAEPEGEYEQIFNKLPRKERQEKLYNEIETSAAMTLRIQQFIENNLTELEDMSEDELYKKLCQVAFVSDDESAVQTKYSLAQRRGFRLSILNFLETRKLL